MRTMQIINDVSLSTSASVSTYCDNQKLLEDTKVIAYAARKCLHYQTGDVSFFYHREIDLQESLQRNRFSIALEITSMTEHDSKHREDVGARVPDGMDQFAKDAVGSQNMTPDASFRWRHMMCSKSDSSVC